MLFGGIGLAMVVSPLRSVEIGFDGVSSSAVPVLCELCGQRLGEVVHRHLQPGIVERRAEQALEQARTNGWTVVSINHDWATVF